MRNPADMPNKTDTESGTFLTVNGPFVATSVFHFCLWKFLFQMPFYLDVYFVHLFIVVIFYASSNRAFVEGKKARKQANDRSKLFSFNFERTVANNYI